MESKTKKSRTTSSIEEFIEELIPSMINLRHTLHQHPETGFLEFETNKKIKEFLSSLGLSDFVTMAKTGLVVDIHGTGNIIAPTDSVSCIALRADIDALPMTEQNDHLPYRSVNPGAAHMCGHDGHMVSLLGAAAIMAKFCDRIPQNKKVRLLFQPAEESPGGAKPMIEEGCLNGVDEVYGYHNWPSTPLGMLAVVPGPVLAHVSDFYIDIIGKGGHASTPHVCADPIVAASHVVIGLQSIISRSVPSKENAVVTVASINGGTTTNVIPDNVTLKGTIRNLCERVDELITNRIQTIVSHTVQAYGCEAKVEMVSRYPAVVNHEKQTDFVLSVAEKVVGKQNITSTDLPKMGAEDFAYFLQHRPGCFFFLGGKTEEKKEANGFLHNARFDFEDKILPIAWKMFLGIVQHRLGAHFLD